MAANYKVFVDGDRLPADQINNFLAKQCVVQVDGQNDLNDLTQYGVRMAMTLDTGALWFYTDLGGWSPLEIDGLLTLDEADERYLTQITAEGLFLTKTEGADFLTGDEIATTYLAKLTAEGLYLSQTDAQQNYLGKTEAAQTYLTQLSAQGLYITTQDANNTFLTQSEANNLYLTPTDGDTRYLTAVQAGQVYLRQDDASSTYQTQPSSGTFITDIQAGSIYISKTDNAGTYVTSISGDKITTGTISANRIGAGTFVGSTFKTASGTSKRVLISGSSNTIKVYNSGDSDLNHRGVIEGLSSGMRMAGSGSSPAYLTVSSSLAFLSSNSGQDIQLGNGIINLDAGARLHIGSSRIEAKNIFEAEGNIYYKAQMGFSESSRLLRIRGSDGILYDSNFTGSSDINLKENVQELGLGLNFIKTLDPIQFTYINNSDEEQPVNFGLSAQDLKARLTEFGYPEDNLLVGLEPMGETEEGEDDPDHYYGVNYDNLVPMLINSVKELSDKNDELESKLASLESRIAAIEGNA